MLPGGHGARTYQDERFSYVVLRRGPRPGLETVPDLSIARQRQIDPPDAVQQAIEAGDGCSIYDLPHTRLYGEHQYRQICCNASN